MYTNKCHGSFTIFIVQSLTNLDNIIVDLYVLDQTGKSIKKADTSSGGNVSAWHA